ncbi:MAG: chorismate mutase [Sulfuricurvum sp.]
MKQFESLEELRSHIDTIDEQLVDLIAKRSALVRYAAPFKESVDEIKANERLDYVVQRARANAIKNEISPNMIEDLFRRMIDEMVEVEISEFQNLGSF